MDTSDGTGDRDGKPQHPHTVSMFELAEKFVAMKESFFPVTSLLQTCTESSSSRIKATLIDSVCYDEKGCCGQAASLSLSSGGGRQSSADILDEKAKANQAPLFDK